MDTDKYGGIREQRKLNTGTSVVRINSQESETSKMRRDVKANYSGFPVERERITFQSNDQRKSTIFSSKSWCQFRISSCTLFQWAL